MPWPGPVGDALDGVGVQLMPVSVQGDSEPWTRAGGYLLACTQHALHLAMLQMDGNRSGLAVSVTVRV